MSAPQLFRPQSDLMSRPEAAAYLGVAEQTLAVWKCNGRYGLPYVKVGSLVRYRKADLDAFIARRTAGGSVESTTNRTVSR